VPNVIRVTLHYTISADVNAVNRFFFKYAGAPPLSPAMETFAVSVANLYSVNLQEYSHPNVTLHLTEAVDLSSPTGGYGSSSAIHQGARAGGALPAGTCLLQHMTIGRRYRGGKPRIYWPFGSDTDLQDSQRWTNAFLTIMGTQLPTFFGQVIANPPPGNTLQQQCNVSYYSGFHTHEGSTGRVSNISDVRPVPLVDLVTGFSVDPRVGSQRRRSRP
jgi:hypothetical protein